MGWFSGTRVSGQHFSSLAEHQGHQQRLLGVDVSGCGNLIKISIIMIVFLEVLGMEARAALMHVAKCFTTEIHPQAC